MKIIDMGLTDFLEAYEVQIDLVKKVSMGMAEDTLLITEHRPVITIGRTGSRENIFKSNEELFSSCIELFNVDRGGDVTYHGPGQIIAYPVFKLEDEGKDIHRFLQYLEDVGKHFLARYGLIAERRLGFRGVWVSGKKIGSIGIGIKKWVTYHGLAINVNVDLTPFSFIKPCGIEGVSMTSLKEVLCCDLDIDDAKDKLKSCFQEISLLAEAVSKI